MVEARLDWIRMLSSGPMKIRRPSIWEWKRDAFFLDFAQLGQGEHLEPAAVGQDGAVASP